jgi:HK97 family phage prohead protease
MNESYDFGGWATRNDIRCSDGRTIRKNAFIENDGQTVPLVWNHLHNSPENVLGHALLENRDSGVYAYCSFNNTDAGRNAKELVKNGDVTALSIYANQLKQQGKNVLHGAIREVSLVLAGANKGAFIDNVAIQHSDGEYDELSDEALIMFDMDDSEEVYHAEFGYDDSEDDYDSYEDYDENNEIEEYEDSGDSEISHADNEEEPEMGDRTVKDVYDDMTDEQKAVVQYMVGVARNNADDEEDEEDTEMKHNVFYDDYEDDGSYLSHSDVTALTADALRDVKNYGSLRDSFMAHAAEYGIEDIDYLFPDAKTITNTPEFIKRETEWVAKVIGKTHHTPFSRIKSVFADITAEEARAKGYIKGTRKKEEVISLLKRVTEPQTVYKKQKFDRDDIIDITDFDAIPWIKGEMRIMLDEEIARAILVGDGRLPSDDDKIKEDRIRPIAKEDALFAIKKVVTGSDVATVAKNMVDDVVIAMDQYRGSGNPDMFIRQDVYTRMLLLKDTQGYRLYKSPTELATAMMVKSLIPVPNDIMGGIYGIVINLTDYNVGADKGGAVNMFDDFDIDYNQMKYLIETRCSGAIVKPFSAIVLGNSDSVTEDTYDINEFNHKYNGKALPTTGGEG